MKSPATTPRAEDRQYDLSRCSEDQPFVDGRCQPHPARYRRLFLNDAALKLIDCDEPRHVMLARIAPAHDDNGSVGRFGCSARLDLVNTW